MSKAPPNPRDSGRSLRALHRALSRAFDGTETEVIGNPVILGCGLFELAVVSPASGCHLFMPLRGDATDARGGQAVALLERLRVAAERAGWASVHGWIVGAPEPTAESGPTPAARLTPWPAGAERTPDAARATLLRASQGKRPSIADRRAAMQALAAAFVDPLGAFDPTTPRSQRQRGDGALRSELDELDRWLAGRILAEEQSRLAQIELDGALVVVQGPAGSGKTTVLARHAARTIHAIAGGAVRGIEGGPRLLVTARTKSAAAQLRARVVASYRRWTGAPRLPRWVDTMDLPDAVKRIRAQRDAGTTPRYQWILVDEAQELDAEWWTWMLRHALRQGPRPRGVLACADDAQRIHETSAPMAAVADAAGLSYRLLDLQTTYRSPRQVLEPAFNVLHGTFAHGTSTTTAREPERLALLRDCRADRAADGWLRVRFAMRGVGIPGAPTGAMPRMVRASSERAAYTAAIRDAIALVDLHGAAPTDIVVVATDQRAALAASRAAAAAGHAGRFTRDARGPIEAHTGRIRILRVTDCRGHDFPVALVVGVERLAGTFAERTLLYQAATRAQHLLIAYGVEGRGLSDELGECIVRAGIELE